MTARILRGLSLLLSLLLSLACLLYVASWPGNVLRELPELSSKAVLVPSVPADAPGRDGSLDVVVRDLEGQPILGAKVRAFAMLDGRAHAGGEGTTDAEGRASIERLLRAAHFVVAEAEGKARSSQMVAVAPGARRVDLTLGEEHTLDLVVKDDSGAAVANAEVEVRAGDPLPVGARTDASGRAHVRKLGEGPFLVTARARGFEETTRRQVRGGAPFTLTLSRQGALRVTVRDVAGKTVQYARVWVTSATLWPARVAETDALGVVRIGALAPGSYSLRAVKGELASETHVGILVERGDERSVELRLGTGVMVAVRVVDDETDLPVAHAKVILTEEGLSPFPIEGESDAKGRLSLGPVSSSAITLEARAEGYVPRSAASLEPGHEEMTVRLARGGTLVGRVRDARGYPIEGATVRIVGTTTSGMPIDEDPQRDEFRDAHFAWALSGPRALVPSNELGVVPGPVPNIPRAATREGAPPAIDARKTGRDPWISGRDGTFRAQPVSPGRVRVLVHHPQYVDGMSATVNLASGGEVVADVVLRQGGTLEGRVVDGRGMPVQNARITALGTRGSFERSERAASDGTFAFAAVPPSVTLLVARDGDLGEVDARVVVEVPDGQRREVEVVLSEPREPLPVRVTDARGRGIDAAQVSAVSVDPSIALRTTSFTDGRGEAQLKASRGVALRVSVTAPGYATRTVSANPELSNLVVALSTAESLTGEVVLNRREAAVGAEVVVQSGGGVRHGRTNAEGVFTVTDLAPGPVHLRVRAEGRAELAVEAQVESLEGRRATDLGRMILAEEGVVEGIVEDERGRPVQGARVARDSVPTYLPAQGALSGFARTDAKGHFRLGSLPEGVLVLEAFAPDHGRARVEGVRVTAGRTTEGVKLVLLRDATRDYAGEVPPAGSVAVTLVEAPSKGGQDQLVVRDVAENSEAERAGLLARDAIVSIGGARPSSLADARARLDGPVRDDVVLVVLRAGETLSLRVPREAVQR